MIGPDTQQYAGCKAPDESPVRTARSTKCQILGKLVSGPLQELAQRHFLRLFAGRFAARIEPGLQFAHA